MALLLGVMGIIAMMEWRRRTELVQADQLHQALTSCVGWLQAIHSSGEAQMGKVAEALSQLRTTVETGIKINSESSASLSSQSLRSVEQAVARLETAIQHHHRANDETMIRAADKLSEASAARANELLSEAKHITKCIRDLQASLEASTKF